MKTPLRLLCKLGWHKFSNSFEDAPVEQDECGNWLHVWRCRRCNRPMGWWWRPTDEEGNPLD